MGKITINRLLKTALLPVGETLYIWGGGWNQEDDGAGEDAKRLGLSPKWKLFFEEQDAAYDYTQHCYERGNGLDCSGYMGWVLYNTLYDQSRYPDYVAKAGKQPRMLEKRGFGFVTKAENVFDWQPGDIMGSHSQGHIYMVLAVCGDGSLVIVHSSPPGVQVSGTVNRMGRKESQAAKKAEEFMKRYHTLWYQRYGIVVKDREYLTEYDRFRWNV